VDLLPFDETRRRLRVLGQAYVGVREIPVERIVGSVDREGDFDRDFRPRRRLSRSRLANFRRAFPDRLQTNYEVPPGVDVSQLVHTEQQRILLEETGLGRARPGAVIEFTLLAGYAQLCDIIKAHGYDLARQRGAVLAPEKVAGDWYDSVYLPALRAARRAGLPERMAQLYEPWGLTDADLVLWLYQLRRDVRAYDASADFDAAARQALEFRLTRQKRRQVRRERSRPLPQRSD
jgi:hypothetical protein